MRDATIHQFPPFPAGLALSPEFRLAVACSWIAPERLHHQQGELVASLCDAGIDWDAFLALVGRHGIPVQALTVLRRCLGDGMPERPYRELLGRGRRKALTSTVQMAELVRINRLLRTHGIDIIPLKGVCLSQRLYGIPGVRASADMDVLIRPENLLAADRLLAAAGYRKIFDLTERQTAAYQAHAQHVNYFSEESGQHLEVHWRNHFWTREEMEDFWCGRETIMMMGEPFFCLDDSLLFLFLCDHGSRHAWFRMKWLSDIAMMLADESIHDGDAVLARADHRGLRRVLAQTSLLVTWLYGIPLPARLSALVAGEKAAFGLAKKAVDALLAGATKYSLWSRRLTNVVYFKRIKPALPFGLILKELFMCPVDYVTFPLPDRLFWMYMPLRPFFWFWRHYGGRFCAKIGSNGKA
jgi:hypothetical protein